MLLVGLIHLMRKEDLNPLKSLILLIHTSPGKKLSINNDNNAWIPIYTCGSLSVNNSDIIIFGGSRGWQHESFIFNIDKAEICKMKQSLKKCEQFAYSHPVYISDQKAYIVGGLYKDIHIYTKQKWFLLEKELIEW